LLGLLGIFIFLAALSVYIVLAAKENKHRREHGDPSGGGRGAAAERESAEAGPGGAVALDAFAPPREDNLKS
jgi:hypothetical protein